MDIRPQPGAQTKFLQSSADIAITGGSAFGGKAVEINTLIPTERGFVRMGEIKPGHRVFAIDGTLSTVLEAFEITLHEDAYEVEFDSGEVFVVDGDHLWKTMTYKERVDAFHRTEEFRDRRRANRPSRAKEVKKNYGASLTITRVNQEREYEYLEPSDGEVRTTSEILETLKVRSDRVNHSVALAKPIELPHNEFIIDPYLFGLWLGDGCASFGLVGCAEEDMNVMLKHIKFGKVIYEKVECNPPRKTPYKSVRFEGLTSYIRKYGLYKNKHIPIEYLRSSKEQRVELLRGLMDTDGTCDKSGKCSISLSDERLIKDVQELICSLGIRCSYHAKPIPGYKTSYGISFTADFSVFHLQRKKDRQQMRKVRSERRYIVDVRKTEPCFMRCIRIDHPSHLYLMGRTFVPTHNTYSLLLEAARHVGNPRYQGIIFRRESVQITSPGGLRDTSLDVYPHLGGLYRAQPSPRWIFPSGAQITFAHLNNEDTVLNYQGSQMTLIAYDELTHFSRFQFFYMLSRARSMSGIKPYIRGSTNPDSDSWVAEFISWWINQETGYPIPERSGVLRYLIRVDDKLIWADSKAELMAQYDCGLDDINSVTFVPSKATDNPLGLKADPSYIGRLKAMSRVERARLLDGNWKIRPVAGMYFPRFDTTILDWKPTDVVKWIRSWDLAASEESEGRDPDWTCGVLAGRRANGKIVIADIVRVRRKAADVRSLVKNMAYKDGKETWCSIPRDPGQAGKEQAESYLQMLQGFTVISRAITRNKLIMAEPAAALWQQGNIELVRADWNEVFLQELEQFPEGRHDDLVDCLSACVRNLPGHAKPDYSQSGLNGRFKEVRSKRQIR